MKIQGILTLILTNEVSLRTRYTILSSAFYRTVNIRLKR